MHYKLNKYLIVLTSIIIVSTSFRNAKELHPPTNIVTGKIRCVKGLYTDSPVCCSPNNITDSPKCQILVVLNKISFSGSAHDTTNSDGRDTLDILGSFPMNVRVYPKDTSTQIKNGLSSSDADLLNRHRLKIEKIACPFKRLAGDVNLNGVLDTQDVIAINNTILNGSSPLWTAPNWRYVSRAYVDKDTADKKDPDFFQDFWNTAYADVNGKQYPFQAIKRIKDSNGVVKFYNYLGTTNTQHTWLDSLHEWVATSTNYKNPSLWDFYGFKMGDVAGLPTAICCNSAPSFTGPNTSLSVRDNKRKRSGKYKNIVIKIHCDEEISSFQFGLKSNENEIQLKKDKIKQNTKKAKFDQNLFTTITDNGELKVSWFNLDGKNILLDNNESFFTVEIDQIKPDLDINNACVLDNSIIDFIVYNKTYESVPAELELVYE